MVFVALIRLHGFMKDFLGGFFFCFHEASMWSGVEGRLTESVKVLGSSKTFVHF
jgi:hypothetical protein